MGPREMFETFRQAWLGHGSDLDVWARDSVLEAPFAPAGQPRRVEGRDDIVRLLRTGRASFPVRFDDCRNVVVHETADPEVIVVEYELVGTVATTGRQSSAPFIGVLRVRDGEVVMWREHQDKAAIAAALA